MATRVTVTAKLDNLKRIKRNITKVNLSKTLADEYARTLKTVINQRSSSPSGNLARSVESRAVGRYGSGVYADNYFWYANYGRAPGRMPPANHPRLSSWGIRTGWDEDTLRQAIAKYGTKPTYFWEAAKQIMSVKKPRVYKKIMKSIKK